MRVLYKVQQHDMPYFKISSGESTSNIIRLYGCNKDIMIPSCYDYSDTAIKAGINNRITSSEVLLNCMVVESYFNWIIRDLINLGKLIENDFKGFTITSAYRCAELNNLLKGSVTSLHLHGLALDVFHTNSTVINSLILELDKYFNGTYNKILGQIYPYEVIQYTNNRIHIGFKYYSHI